MTSRRALPLLLALCALLALPAGAAAGGGKDRWERGILQRATRSAVAIRTLDGGLVVAFVDARTKITVAGRRARLSDLRVGAVALVRFAGEDGRAREVRVLAVRSTAPAGKKRGEDAGGEGDDGDEYGRRRGRSRTR